MTLRKQWKKGELDGLEELIKQIKVVYDSRSLSDEYLKENDCMTREECYVAEEHPYGIVTVISDYVLPYLEQLQIVKDENKKLRVLLKECLVYIPYSYPQFQTEKRIDLDSAKLDLLTRINAAIGESEE